MAAALPAYAHKGRAAKAVEVAWKACPETEREQATRSLRTRQRQQTSCNLVAWMKVAKPKAVAEPKQPEQAKLVEQVVQPEQPEHPRQQAAQLEPPQQPQQQEQARPVEQAVQPEQVEQAQQPQQQAA